MVEMAEIYTHTPISVAEKKFILNCREAMNENSWAFLYVVKKFLGAIELGQLYRML